MPLYEGNLQQFLASGNVKPFVKTIAMDIAKALAYLHKLNIIHRYFNIYT